MGRPVRDHAGKKYGRLLALRFVAQTLQKQAMWECRCDCGNRTVVIGSRLASGRVRSCGCLRRREYKLTPLAHRFWPKVKVGRGCWIWEGAADPGTGYGRVGLGGREDGTATAHRVAYMLTVGSIPDGAILHHHCENPSCVRPDHLEPLTRAEHIDLHREDLRS